MSEDKKPGFTIGVIGTGRANMEMLAGIALGPGAAEIKSAPIIDAIKQKPDVEGPHGRAWLCDVAAGLAKMGISPEQDSSLAHWVVEAPWAHPVWHSYSIVVIHLRPMPDGRETMIYLPEATHEMWVFAHDATVDRAPLLATGIVDKNWLHPGNFAAQFVEVTDDLALARIRASVQAICDGRLSPDTDFRRAWIALYGDNMQKDRPNRRPPTVRKR